MNGQYNEIEWSDAVWSEVRIICYLAEAVFAGFLGSYTNPGIEEALLDVCPYGLSLPWFGVCSHSPLTDPVRTATSKHETKAKQKEYFKVYYSAYKQIMTRKDQDRLKENTRVYRAASSAGGEKKKKHLAKRKQLRSYWSEEKKKEGKKKRKLRDQQPGIKEAQNKRIRERRANDPEYREMDNRRRRI